MTIIGQVKAGNNSETRVRIANVLQIDRAMLLALVDLSLVEERRGGAENSSTSITYRLHTGRAHIETPATL